MSLSVSKDCFPAPIRCFNCVRKWSSDVKKETGPKDEYKRCANCHLMTYCDKDCQREHWIKIHKSHCRFLSGKTLVNDSVHNAENCTRCIEEREARPAQIDSENSPKTGCNIEAVNMSMKKAIGESFGFHKAGKKCDCSLTSLNFGLRQLPFALGEVSGQYLGMGKTGLDVMLAHVFKILYAMCIKAEAENEETKGALLQELWMLTTGVRAGLWSEILLHGRPVESKMKDLVEKVDSLQTIYGVNNPWWKALDFSVRFAISTKQSNGSTFKDSSSFEDPRFQNLKIVHKHHQSQDQKQALVSEKKMWPNFLLWPQLVSGSLVLLLPPGTRCHSCNAKLCGEMSPHELFTGVGDEGALMAFCSPAKKMSCRIDCLNKHVPFSEAVWEEHLKEFELFAIESRDCDFCMKASLSSHRCASCLTVQYCSTVCQKKDLEFHITVCSTWAKDKSRRILGKGKQRDHRKKSSAKK